MIYFSAIQINLHHNAVSCYYANFNSLSTFVFAGNYVDSLSDAKFAVDLLPSFVEAIFRGKELKASLDKRNNLPTRWRQYLKK